MEVERGAFAAVWIRTSLRIALRRTTCRSPMGQSGTAVIEYLVAAAFSALLAIVALVAIRDVPKVVLGAAAAVVVAANLALGVARRYRGRRDRIATTLKQFADEELDRALAGRHRRRTEQGDE